LSATARHDAIHRRRVRPLSLLSDLPDCKPRHITTPLLQHPNTPCLQRRRDQGEVAAEEQADARRARGRGRGRDIIRRNKVNKRQLEKIGTKSNT